MGVEESTGYAHDVIEAMIALRAIGETRAGSSPAARILFFKYLKYVKSNIKIKSYPRSMHKNELHLLFASFSQSTQKTA